MFVYEVPVFKENMHAFYTSNYCSYSTPLTSSMPVIVHLQVMYNDVKMCANTAWSKNHNSKSKHSSLKQVQPFNVSHELLYFPFLQFYPLLYGTYFSNYLSCCNTMFLF